MIGKKPGEVASEVGEAGTPAKTPALLPHPTPKANTLTTSPNFTRTNSNEITRFVARGQAIYRADCDWPPVLSDSVLGNEADRLELFRIIAHLLNHWADMKFIADKSLKLLIPRAAPNDPHVNYLCELFTHIKDIP